MNEIPTVLALRAMKKVNELQNKTKSVLNGKTLNILGDDMVHGHTLEFDKAWASILATKNGMTVRDYGVNGTCIAGTSNASGDSMVTRYANMEDSANYIGVFGGTNDQIDAIPIGTDTDSTVDTFKGSLNILCDGLITKYPSAKIFFITPYNHNNDIKDYVDAIKTICAKYSIPVFDNYMNGGVCWSNNAQTTALTLGDGYHLNEVGHQYVSTKYEAFIKSL
ncbi:hypothetical protein COE51_16315 [Bacillus pseudomycoides]|nr:hypothetical protein COE51_16315 [Bacillus pseudomycoides]